jgi:phage N-6-adenine-methyltransferase
MSHYQEQIENDIKNTEHKSFTPIIERDLWQTPQALFDTLDREFDFVCDVAASDENKLCDMWITEEMNSFDTPWLSSNWCNPPYSDVTPWVKKAIEQHKLSKTIVMLVPSDTSVKWFKMAYESCNEVRFISGRLSFTNVSTGKPVSGNNKGSVLFIWRGNCPVQSKTVSLVSRESLMGIKQ